MSSQPPPDMHPPARPVPGAFPFGLREIVRALEDVHAADAVMDDVVREIDEMAFQTDVLDLRGREADAVAALQTEARELKDLAGKLGSLVGLMADNELAERHRLLGPRRDRAARERRLDLHLRVSLRPSLG